MTRAWRLAIASGLAVEAVGGRRTLSVRKARILHSIRPVAVLPERLVAELDRYVDRTPADRDRFVDLLRVVSIAVVILWHWVLSITQWRDGALVMPNPIDVIPGGWLVTWFLQTMPLFFVG